MQILCISLFSLLTTIGVQSVFAAPPSSEVNTHFFLYAI